MNNLLILSVEYGETIGEVTVPWNVFDSDLLVIIVGAHDVIRP